MRPILIIFYEAETIKISYTISSRIYLYSWRFWVIGLERD